MRVFRQEVPKKGAVVISANHPFGGIEGVILSLVLGQVRPDLKVLANKGLKLFPELSDYFIFTNPLNPGDRENLSSVRACHRHLKNGGALLVFPAGRVAYYQADKQRVSEHEWSRLVWQLISRNQAMHLPIFVNGHNSPLFYRLGRIYYRFRLLMLAREMLNKHDANVGLHAGRSVPASQFNRDAGESEHSALCRIMSYSHDPKWRYTWPDNDQSAPQQRVSPQVSFAHIQRELDALPANQHLLDYKDYCVYFGYQHQLPTTVHEIARLREHVFRKHNEGSGEAIDSDKFDATYTHLFVVNRDKGIIIGAYRMGQTDRLMPDTSAEGLKHLYLSRMFDFGAEFVNRKEPCLEMGRSFLIPEYQRSYQGLYLLWRGIGAFVARHPQYRTLYGTVSISKLYDPRSVVLIRDGLVTPTDSVQPKQSLPLSLHPEIADFSQDYDLSQHLTPLLANIESDSKDVPVLVRHYQKMGAQFHCLGIDTHFNFTPGLLLSVDLTKAPHKLMKLYMGKEYEDYLKHQRE